MNWLLPTPVSPIVRKCLLSSRRRMRSGLVEDMERKPISFRGAVESAARHKIRPAQGNAFARPFSTLKVEGETAEKESERYPGPKSQRRFDDFPKLTTAIDLVLQPEAENTWRGAHEAHRHVTLRFQAGWAGERLPALHKNEISPGARPRMEERNHGSYRRLGECAADILREVKPFERRLVAMPDCKDRNG
jgi:hypothetical protein